jgi:hypothetical protein
MGKYTEDNDKQYIDNKLSVILTTTTISTVISFSNCSQNAISFVWN